MSAGGVGNTTPTWTPDGNALVYWQSGLTVRADFTTEPRFQVLSRRNLSDVYVGIPEDIHPDGERLLMLSQGQFDAAGQEQPSLLVVANWFTELRQRLGEAGG